MNGLDAFARFVEEQPELLTNFLEADRRYHEAVSAWTWDWLHKSLHGTCWSEMVRYGNDVY